MEDKPSWDRDGQVFYCGGHAWGIGKVRGDVGELKTVCLGTEEDVKKRLAGERSGISQTPPNQNLRGVKM